MANLLGIDISEDTVRVAVLRTGYRKISLVALQECPLEDFPTVAETVRAVAVPNMSRGDSIATALPGDRLFVRKVELPPTALRQLAEVLPFELESQLPFDLEDVIYDSRLMPRDSGKAPVVVLACVARVDQVQDRITTIQTALNAEPERVDASSFVLSNLATVVPELTVPGPVALVHLDGATTDVSIIKNGQVEFVRTVTGGTIGLPASAKPLARDLRQTMLGWQASGGAPLEHVYLLGPGSGSHGAELYLSAELGVNISFLPAMRLDGLTAEFAEMAPRFSRAVALALSLMRNPRSMNLRQGPLAYERGYGFLREKVPLLAAIGTLIFVSFLFSTWMELRTLKQQADVLEEALASVTSEVVGETIRDPEMAEDAVSLTSSKLDDPMPHVDGFDLMVEISKAVPPELKHDIEELDFQKGKATIHGIVPSIPDAQQIASTLGKLKCFENVKIVRTVRVINEDRQKYVLEFEVKCPAPGKENRGDKGGPKDTNGKEDKE